MKEIAYMLSQIDADADSCVKISDFEVFIKDDQAAQLLLHPIQEDGIVDLRISTTEGDEVNLKREGYVQLQPHIREESSSKLALWYKKAPRVEGKSSIMCVKYSGSSRDTELVSKGFTCLQQDINKGGAFAKKKYMWISFVPPNGHNSSEVIDICLSSGDLDDKKDARLWLPLYRGFKLVPGNLNEKNVKTGVFLWLRKRKVLQTKELMESNPEAVADSPRAKSKSRMHADDIESQVRYALRRMCPVDQDGALNFGRLFEEFDTKKTRSIGKQAVQAGIEAFGIKMDAKVCRITFCPTG
ncbi:hypothetical protein PINS_up013978 [Pythium insidiosum]|nr:hypothetical protein PINS_up013978 [Pythium insidiosum]